MFRVWYGGQNPRALAVVNARGSFACPETFSETDLRYPPHQCNVIHTGREEQPASWEPQSLSELRTEYESKKFLHVSPHLTSARGGPLVTRVLVPVIAYAGELMGDEHVIRSCVSLAALSCLLSFWLAKGGPYTEGERGFDSHVGYVANEDCNTRRRSPT